MAKEKFLVIASPMEDDCFGRFSETANREAISNGSVDENDAYAWVEKAFEIRLVRYREATHLCSVTPSARYEWIENCFVGTPNAAWEDNGDPECLEHESGGEYGGYGTYRDEYDKRFVCYTFTVDTMKDLEEPMRKPADNRSEAGEKYLDAIWKFASEYARDTSNGIPDAPIFGVTEYRKWEKECRDRMRQRSLDDSKAGRAFI